MYHLKDKWMVKHLEQLLQENERSLVSLMHANNELGTLPPIKEVGELCKKYDALFHSDTVQTMDITTSI